MASPSVVPSITGVAAASVGVVALVPDAPDAGAAAPVLEAPPPPPPPPPQPATISKTPMATNREPSRSNIAYSMRWLKMNM
ncbi:hypothetical protein CUJ87_23270 [Paraburkholderia caledonica]|nr:hypothetical protein CUJ87_23270 [Paraburkholderia caledonica]